MSYSPYSIKVNKEVLEKFKSIPDSLTDLQNIVPRAQKNVFNFQGRKSPDVAQKILSLITDPNSLMCDPFFGSGSFLISGISSNHKVMGIELDNYTFDVFRVLHTKVDFDKLNSMFNIVKDMVYDEIIDLYYTECCGEKNYIKTLYFDPETNEYYHPQSHREIINGENIRLYSTCTICGKSSKKFEDIDYAKLQETNQLNTAEFPHHNLIENSRINITASTGADKYDRNFINRSKYALLKIQKSILSLDSCIERDILEHALVSSLSLSKISQYGSGSMYIYQVMRFQSQETNVWYLFETKFRNFVSYKSTYAANTQFEDLNSDNFRIVNGSYDKVLESNSYNEIFDIIYSDPPYTDQVQYLERSQLFRDWLNIFYFNNSFKLTSEMLEKELVVSNAPSRSRTANISSYYKHIDSMFSTFYRILKANGIVALTLNLGKARYFRTLSKFIDYARKNGFEYIYRIDLTKNDPSLRKQAAYKNTLSNETLVFFIKLPEERKYWYHNEINLEHEVVKFIYNLLNKQDNCPIIRSINETINFLVHKYSILASEEVINKIKNIITSYFYIDEYSSRVYIDPNRLYLSVEDTTTLFGKLYDIVPVIINKLLNNKGFFVLEDLYFEISSQICNGDPSLLGQILSSPERELTLINLLKNYCDIDDRVYTKKKTIIKPNDDAIDISVLDGYEFEELIKRLLTSEGYTDVIRIGGAGDRGIDLRAKKINNGIVEGYIFQAKRWISNVGSEPIQRLHSMRTQYPSEIHHAICITTSDFTEYGKREAENTGVSMVNGTMLMERLNSAFPGEYYHELLNFNSDYQNGEEK